MVIQKYSELVKKGKSEAKSNANDKDNTENVFKSKIIEILGRQGKIHMMKKVKQNETTLLELIQSDDYFISSLDVWVLALHYSIPLIMLNKVSLQETKYKQQIMSILQNEENYYYFLQQSAIDHSKSEKGNPITYSLYSNKNDVFKISLDKLTNSELVDKIKRGELEIKLDDFIKNFSLENDRKANKTIVTKIHGEKTIL